jgi:hypothetical protein
MAVNRADTNSSKPMNSDPVVFSASCTQALVAMAIEEKLAFMYPGEGHDAFEHFRSISVPSWLRRQISEQLILAPSVLGPFSYGEFLQGSLIDDGILSAIPASPNAPPKVHLEAVDFAVLSAALRMRGIASGPGELIELSQWVFDELDAIAAETERLGLPNNFSAWHYVAKFVTEWPIAKGVPPDVQALMDRKRNLDRETSGYMSAIADIENAVVAAEHSGSSRLFLPRLNDPEWNTEAPFSIRDAGFGKEATEVAILRLVSTQLGRLPFRTTLRDTLKMSRTSAAEDLRYQIGEWSLAIVAGDVDEIVKIERKIRRAKSALDIAQSSSHGGQIATYVGVALMAASAVVGVPTELGVTVTLLGGTYQMVGDSLKRSYRWASFGD